MLIFFFGLYSQTSNKIISGHIPRCHKKRYISPVLSFCHEENLGYLSGADILEKNSPSDEESRTGTKYRKALIF